MSGYVYVCAGCDKLAIGRADSLTCCGACRVRAHRNGSIKVLHKTAEFLGLRDERTNADDRASHARRA